MFNPKRLSFARERRGLSKKGLADRLDVSPRAVTAWESGQEPSPENLRVLASELHFPLAFFEGDDIARIPDQSASFRSLSKMTSGQRDAALAAGSLALRLAAWLDDRFELPGANLPEFHEDPDPESAAQQVRIDWGLGERPIGNLVHLLESKGVRVFSLVEDCAEVDAFSLWSDKTPFVFLNTRKSAERSRFDAAHELGHLVLHKQGAPTGRAAEDQANAFASALLMPKAGVLAHGAGNPSIRTIVRDKQLWGASAVAYAFRLRRLEVLSDWHYHQLMRKMSALGYRRNEPAPRSRETSQLLRKALAELRSRGVGKGEIAAELGLYRDDLESLVFGLVLTGLSGDGLGTPRSNGSHLQLVTS